MVCSLEAYEHLRTLVKTVVWDCDFRDNEWERDDDEFALEYGSDEVVEAIGAVTTLLDLCLLLSKLSISPHWGWKWSKEVAQALARSRAVKTLTTFVWEGTDVWSDLIPLWFRELGLRDPNDIALDGDDQYDLADLFCSFRKLKILEIGVVGSGMLWPEEIIPKLALREFRMPLPSQGYPVHFVDGLLQSSCESLRKLEIPLTVTHPLIDTFSSLTHLYLTCRHYDIPSTDPILAKCPNLRVLHLQPATSEGIRIIQGRGVRDDCPMTLVPSSLVELVFRSVFVTAATLMRLLVTDTSPNLRKVLLLRLSPKEGEDRGVPYRWSPEELRKVAELCSKRGIFVRSKLVAYNIIPCAVISRCFLSFNQALYQRARAIYVLRKSEQKRIRGWRQASARLFLLFKISRLFPAALNYLQLPRSDD